jgi:molecular chaperone DnaK (HSP70)
MSNDKHDNRIALGVDVGTSTCQAYIHISGTRRMLWVEGSAAQQEYYPSAILEQEGGARLYGFEALVGAQQYKGATLHHTFKAFMKADPPLERAYEIDEAAALFQDMAAHFLTLLMPEIKRMAARLKGSTRLDVSFTLPGGWAQDPRLTSTYHQVIFDLERMLRGELATNNIEVFAYLVEEPVAALLGIESMFLDVPENEPTLVIDAGGGTLDAAVCVAKRDDGEGLLHYAIPFSSSIGVAGESLFEEFVKTLTKAKAFSKKLPRLWRRDASLRDGLKRIFREYSLVPVDTFTREISADDERIARLTVTFSPAEVEAKLLEGPRFKQITRFVGGLLKDYCKLTGEDRETWGASYLVGGLGRYKLFKQEIMKLLPSCQTVPNPQEIIAIGAVTHAERGGLQIRERACPYHLGQQVNDLSVGKLVWDLLVKQGELISTAHDKTFLGDSHVHQSGSGFKATFGWTESESIEDTVMLIFEDSVRFETYYNNPVPLQAGDALQTRVRFDDKLRLEIDIVHVRTGLVWSTSGLRW